MDPVFLCETNINIQGLAALTGSWGVPFELRCNCSCSCSFLSVFLSLALSCHRFVWISTCSYCFILFIFSKSFSLHDLHIVLVTVGHFHFLSSSVCLSVLCLRLFVCAFPFLCHFHFSNFSHFIGNTTDRILNILPLLVRIFPSTIPLHFTHSLSHTHTHTHTRLPHSLPQALTLTFYSSVSARSSLYRHPFCVPPSFPPLHLD